MTVFRGRIDKIFDDGTSSYCEDRHRRTVNFMVYGHEVEFDKLAELSRLLNTKMINIGTETREEGGCETCWYSQDYTTLFASEVDFGQEEDSERS